jgi:hypothetical protein
LHINDGIEAWKKGDINQALMHFALAGVQGIGDATIVYQGAQVTAKVLKLAGGGFVTLSAGPAPTTNRVPSTGGGSGAHPPNVGGGTGGGAHPPGGGSGSGAHPPNAGTGGGAGGNPSPIGGDGASLLGPQTPVANGWVSYLRDFLRLTRDELQQLQGQFNALSRLTSRTPAQQAELQRLSQAILGAEARIAQLEARLSGTLFANGTIPN